MSYRVRKLVGSSGAQPTLPTKEAPLVTLTFLQSRGLAGDLADKMRSRVIENTMLNSLNLVDKVSPWHPLKIIMAVFNIFESCTISQAVKPDIDDTKMLCESCANSPVSSDHLSPCLRRVQMEAGAIYKAMRLAPFGQKVLECVGRIVGNLKSAELETRADERMQTLLTQTEGKSDLAALETWITINQMLVVATEGHMGMGSFQAATSKIEASIEAIKAALLEEINATISEFLQESLSKEQV
jgi:hypothetical protein